MIRIQGLNKTYGRRRGDNRVLKDITLTLPDTGFVCILGPSGCGKTSLLNAIGGLDKFDNGSISIQDVTANRYGKRLFEAERNRNFGYIFQNYYLLTEHSVGYNVYLGLHSLQLTHEEKLERVQEALRAVEMERYFHRDVSNLSGGQQQRVAIARALARKPQVIFADEPTGNLDEANTRNICALLRKISKTSLVVMVTHEQRIAQFFADRIIRLDNGVIFDDSDRFQRGTLNDSATLYTGDFVQETLESNGIRVRFYRQEDCGSVDVSILALKDRVVIKLTDGRTITCGQTQDQPVVVEGPRPELTLEGLEEEHLSWQPGGNVPAKAGRGIRFRDMLREALHMGQGKGLRKWGTRLFLLLLTVLTALTVADFVALSRIDPETFITTHSQMLEVKLERGGNAGANATNNQLIYNQFKESLAQCSLECYFAPKISVPVAYYGSLFYQLDELSIPLKDFSYAPLDYLDESSLIMGRMPETSQEIVVDRWVLEAAMAQDGVVQNGVTGIDFFLDGQLAYDKKSYSPTIVGICDSGEPAIYMFGTSLLSLVSGDTEVATLSSLQAAYPGVYDDVELGEGECLVLPENAGNRYFNMLYSNYAINAQLRTYIVGIVPEDDFYADIIVADDQVEQMLLYASSGEFQIYCADKAAMTAYLYSIAEDMDGIVKVTVYDHYATAMEEYREETALRMDARSIVMATVMVLSMVMLYLLRRSQVLERIGMLSVYRLLGIPKRKAAGIFCLESVIGCLRTVLPVVLVVWLVLLGLNALPETQTQMLLPLPIALLVGVGITVFHLLVTVFPLQRLLRLPPAQLAAKFDF